MGDDLDEFAWERKRLDRCEALVAVPVASAAAEETARSILAGYCQSSLQVHGTWTRKVVSPPGGVT